MHTSVKVEIQPDGRVVTVFTGTSLIEAVGKAGVILDTPCGGQGRCGKCRVQIVGSPHPPSAADRDSLAAEDLDQGYRLACQTKVLSDLIVRIPDQARMFQQKILTAGVGREVRLDPNVTKRAVIVPAPSLEDQRSDFDRLVGALDDRVRGVWAELDVMRSLPAALRQGGSQVTITLEGREIIGIDSGDTTDRLFGVAFDIGTTTVVGMLVDLRTGHEAAVAARTNPQVVYGDDVVSRIRFANDNPAGLRQLQKTILDCVNEIIGELAAKAGIDADSICEATFAGNSTMDHLLLGVDPRSLGEMPFVAAVRGAVNIKAEQLGVGIRPGGNVHTLPNIASFVGGDTVGVILAAGMLDDDRLRLAIDIGTNGEIVLGSSKRLVCCSTAAGPAFEGARIRFGMRAADGAIDKVVFNEDVELSVLGGGAPRGICGTGLIDAVAEALRHGLIDTTGRFRSREDVPAGLPDAIRRRIINSDGGAAFVLADNGPEGKPLVLTQRDIREVQLAKGAISAGVATLMAELGVQPADIEEVLLAGAFGNFIRRSQAKRIGLLPNVPTERIRFVGNAAGAGAKMALVAQHCRAEAERISESCKCIELATRTDFHMAFAEAMIFPSE